MIFLLTYIFYLFTAAFASWIFKYVAAIVEGLSMLAFGLYTGKIEENIERKPKTFFSVLIIKNTFLGLLNSYIILYVTTFFFLNYDINYWVYIITSIIWSLSILSYSGINPWIYFFTSTVNLAFLWMGFGWISFIVIGLLTIVIGFSYHFGRINMYLQEFSQDNAYKIE